MSRPPLQRLPLLPVKRVFDVDGAGDRPLGRAYMVQHQTDRVRTDAEDGHAGGHGAAEVVDAEVIEAECWPCPADGARWSVRRDGCIAFCRWEDLGAVTRAR